MKFLKFIAILLILACAAFVGYKYFLNPSAGHQHEASLNWLSDDANHWHACTGEGCEEILDKAVHSYDDEFDATCNVCDEARQVPYFVTVIGGTAVKDKAMAGETVTLTADAAGENQVFSHWTLNGVKIEGNSFEMPDKAAVVKACRDEQGMTFKTAAEFTLGVAAKTTVDAATKAATAEADGVVAMYTDFACAVVAEGKVIATLNDAIQPKIAINAAGEIGDTTFKGTKRELKEGYNMAAYGAPNVEGGTVLEWYVQSAAFSNYVVGKTATEIDNMETKEVNNHQIAVDEALLNAGCTMQITEFMAAVVKACNDEQGMSFKTAATFTLGVAAKTTVDSATKAATAEADGVVAMYTDFACAVVADGKVIATLNDAIQPKIATNEAGATTPA